MLYYYYYDSLTAESGNEYTKQQLPDDNHNAESRDECMKQQLAKNDNLTAESRNEYTKKQLAKDGNFECESFLHIFVFCD